VRYVFVGFGELKDKAAHAPSPAPRPPEETQKAFSSGVREAVFVQAPRVC
jgi:hypothetical protein